MPMPLARWLAATFGLGAEDARADDNYALCWACANGHLAVAQWLVAGQIHLAHRVVTWRRAKGEV